MMAVMRARSRCLALCATAMVTTGPALAPLEGAAQSLGVEGDWITRHDGSSDDPGRHFCEAATRTAGSALRWRQRADGVVVIGVEHHAWSALNDGASIRYELVIDGHASWRVSAEMQDEAATVMIDQGDQGAETLRTALITGREVALRSGEGHPLDRFSLLGSSAAFAAVEECAIDILPQEWGDEVDSDAALAAASQHKPGLSQAELTLQYALTYNVAKGAREFGRADAIKTLIDHGLVPAAPDRRSDYTDYRFVDGDITFLGHDVLAVTEDYLIEWIGCCVDPGIGVVLRKPADLSALIAFSEDNACDYREEPGIPLAPDSMPERDALIQIHCPDTP